MNMRRTSGIAKVAGILICTAGVATLAFYKGPDFRVVSHASLRLSSIQGTSSPSSSSIATWIKGCFIMLLSNTLWALWLVLQVGYLPTYKRFNSRLIIFFTHIGPYILYILWLYCMQGRVLKSYPSKLLFTTLQCLLSAFQSFFIAVAVERHPQQWTLGWNVRLTAVAYCV